MNFLTFKLRFKCFGNTQCATGYPVPVPANPANIFQSGSGQILAGFLKIIQKFPKMLKM